MANIYHNDDGVLMAELAGVAFPFRYLSGHGVAEVVRVCMGQEPLCVLEARGSKGKNIDEGSVLAKNAQKLLTPEGLEWAANNRPKSVPEGAKLLIPEVAPDEASKPIEMDLEDEIKMLLAEQKVEMQEASLC